jgi:plastocyanin
MTKLSRVAATLATSAMLVAPVASQAATTTAFSPGDLIKGSGSTVYYFGPDGRRYVFPNDKTYFTWFSDFSKVKQVPDGVLGTIPLARQNITYRPGKKMVKITTDPRTYVVDQGGVLRHIGSEQLAETLYGLNWKNQIDDVPDAFFVNYKVGTGIQTASDYKPQDVTAQTTTIAMDKQLDETKPTVTIGSAANGFVPTTITIKKGATVTWTNNDSSEHSIVGKNWGSNKNLKYNESWSYTFNEVGSFDYHCGIHPVMQGTINVVN